MFMDVMSGNLPTNQRPIFAGNSPEHDGMLMKSEGHVWVQSQHGENKINVCGDNRQNSLDQSRAGLWWEIIGGSWYSNQVRGLVR